MKGMLFLISLTICLQAQQKKNAPTEVRVEYDEEESSHMQVDRMFKDSAWASGLSSGADTLNRSLDSLMEALFYKLLDNQLVYDVTDASQFTAKLKRDVHTTADGSYVVVDRFSLGPRFLAPLTTMMGAPLNLGGDSNINVLDIYLRTDGMRLAEEQELGFWRRAANNWFGLLPILTNILPPSFNPNELYDPIRQLETPFQFPFTLNELGDMPIGSIRSYSFSGGINLTWDIAEAYRAEISDLLDASNDLTVSLPYSIFRTGEHRINVLKKSNDLVWVGVSDVQRQGHGLSTSLGKVARVFAQVTPYWSGMPAAIFPIDVGGTLADVKKFDLLYSFDLRKEEARVAYLRAVRGDFTLAHKRNLETTTTQKDTGVRFHFTRKQDSWDTEINNTSNFFVYRRGRHQLRSEGEIETTDEFGKFYSLESEAQTEDETWDALVGGRNIHNESRITLKVEREEDRASKDRKEFIYRFPKDEKDPIGLILSMNIQDRFTDAQDYKDYTQALRFFLDMDLPEVPDIPLRDEEVMSLRRKEQTMIDPLRDSENLHVTPTYLGRFQANAAIYIDTDDIHILRSLPEDKYWEAFGYAFYSDKTLWARDEARNRFLNQLRWITFAGAYPLRLLNLRFASADAIAEAKHRVSALEKLKRAQQPMEKLNAFHELLDTDHQVQLARALQYLLPKRDVARSVSFSTQAKGDAQGAAHELFESINRKVFRSGRGFPVDTRYRLAREKLFAFEPRQLTDERQKPYIKQIIVHTQNVNQRYELAVVLEVPKKQWETSLKAYVKLEEGGRVNVGRFVLAESVLDLSPVTVGAKEGSSTEFRIFLSGEDSPLKGLLYDGKLKNQGSYEITLAISYDGLVWSEERKLRFRFVDGRLLPPK